MSDPLEEYLAKKAAATAPADSGDPLEAYLAKKTAPAAPASAKPLGEQPGFFRRGIDSIGHGGQAIANVFGKVLHQTGQRMAGAVGLEHEAPPTSEESGAQRRELLRGVDDVTTLGYGQKLAARAGNALGDTAENSLDETKHFNADPLQGDIDRGPSLRQTRDPQLAPDFRTVGQIGGGLLPNPVGRTLGKAGGAISRFAPARLLAAASRVPAVLAAPAAALGEYEAVAPAQAALSANAEGHRAEAAGQAATDPGGLLMSGGAGAVFGPIRKAVMNSEGGQKRAYIEQHGEGAKVAPWSSGKGGVYDNQLAGVPKNDAGIGQAEKIGATNILDDLETRHEAEHGYPYRGGQSMVREASDASKEAASQGRTAILGAKEQRRADVSRVKREILGETAQRSKQLIGDNTAERRATVSDPYEAMRGEIDASPEASNKQDATHVVKLMRQALRDPRTPHDVRVKLQGDVDLMEQYSDAPSPAELGPAAEPPPPLPPDLVTLLKARETASPENAKRMDQLIAVSMAALPAATAPARPARAVRYMVPENHLNGLRANVMEQAKVGASDARPRAGEAPLRAAAFALKDMVDQGPYGELNRRFAEGASKNEAARLAIGLKRKPARDAAAEQENLAKRLRKGINDPTMIPGKKVPDAANLEPLRQRLSAAEQSAVPTIQQARAEAGAARGALKQTQAKRAAGDAAAVPDRTMLGLNPKIGLRKTDVNQVGLALGRQGANTETAGRSSADLNAFRAAHPEHATNTRLPVLARNRLDLQFGLAPSHGGIIGQLHEPGVVRTLKRNLDPINARLLYGTAKKADPVAIARALGVSRGASLGQKVRAAIELHKEQRQ